MDFKYSIEDYKKIPGLYRLYDGDDPFLVPIFFEKECLVNFFYSSEYRCGLCSETYGSISTPGFNIPFGINKNNKVIFWLGDLKRLPGKEQIMLFPFNVESDHDISSEFYDAQIDAIFTDPAKEVEILLQKNKINEKLGFPIFKNSPKNIDVILEKCGRYKRIMFNSEDDLKRIISELSEDLIEDIDRDAILQKNENDSDKAKALGGIKLFERYIINNYKIPDNLFNSYFILYDLRIWADHKGGKDKFNFSLERLGLNRESTYEEIYEKLMDELLSTNNSLLNL